MSARWWTFACLLVLGTMLTPTSYAQEPAPAPGVASLDLVAQVGGPLATVAVRERRAYVGVGYRLVVLDRTDAVHPVALGQSEALPGPVRSVLVDGSYVYVGFGTIGQADTAGLRIFDISDARHPVEMGNLAGLALDIAVVSHYEYLAIASGEQGLRIVDVSNPDAPRVAAVFTTPGTVDRVTLAGGLAYTTGSPQDSPSGVLRIVRLTNPTGSVDPIHPVELGRHEDPDRSAAGVAVQGRFLYLALPSTGLRPSLPGALRVLDVADPSHPTVVRSTPTSMSPRGVIAADLRLYVTEQSRLHIFDLTDPTNPLERGTVDAPGVTDRLVLAGSHVYLAGNGGGLRVIDVGDPARPAEVGRYLPPGPLASQSVAAADGYAYVGSGQLDIVDLADPARPVPVGSLPLPGVVRANTDGKARLYVANADGLRVLDISVPGHPVEAGKYEATGLGRVLNLALRDRYAYLAAGELRILDVSDSGHPTQVGAYTPSPPGTVVDVAVGGRYAYVAAWEGRLRVIDLADRAQPVEVGSFTPPRQGASSNVALSPDGTRLYLIDQVAFQPTLYVLDLNDAAHPAPVATYPIQGGYVSIPGEQRLVASGGFLYFTGGALRVFDVRNPEPFEASVSQHSGADVAITGSFVSVAARDQGLKVLSFHPPDALPTMAHDERYFRETGYRVDDDSIWGYVQARGGIETFGFPVSRTFRLLGCQVQVFQRQALQVCEGQAPVILNLLDVDIFPYTLVSGSILPRPDPALKAATPPVDDPDYAIAILDFVRANAPDTWNGQPVNFWQTFLNAAPPDAVGVDDPDLRGLVALEVWGAPISSSAVDPRNPNFIYQRFQRGVMHYDAITGHTQGLLLADYLKQIVRNSEDLPPDLRNDAHSSRFFHQYCPGRPNWLCRPAELPGTDLTFAFEPG